MSTKSDRALSGASQRRLELSASAAAERLFASAYPAWSAQQIQEELREAACWGVEVGKSGELVAWLSASLVPPAAELRLVLVHPAERRKGLAQGLVECLIQEALVCGCSEVMLEVRISNTPARRLYARLGFEEVGIRKHYYRAPQEDAVILRHGLGLGREDLHG